MNIDNNSPMDPIKDQGLNTIKVSLAVIITESATAIIEAAKKIAQQDDIIEELKTIKNSMTSIKAACGLYRTLDLIQNL